MLTSSADNILKNHTYVEEILGFLENNEDVLALNKDIGKKSDIDFKDDTEERDHDSERKQENETYQKNNANASTRKKIRLDIMVHEIFIKNIFQIHG